MTGEELREKLAEKLERLLKEGGACDVGFAKPDDSPETLPYAVSVVVPLSDAVIDEIAASPTYAYFHHYRTVNTLIDGLVLRAGLLLQQNGFRYLPVAASQSVGGGDVRAHRRIYPHKKAAVASGLGTIGKSSLFLHRVYGPRVRLGTLFTDCPLPLGRPAAEDICGSCQACVKACPAGAINGAVWRPGIPREELINADLCNAYMRGHFMKIGRGSVCGLCIRACPKGELAEHDEKGGIVDGSADIAL